jgi:hypothetical protein
LVVVDVLDDVLDACQIPRLLFFVPLDLIFQQLVLGKAFGEFSAKHINILPLNSCLALLQVLLLGNSAWNVWDFFNFFRQRGLD